MDTIIAIIQVITTFNQINIPSIMSLLLYESNQEYRGLSDPDRVMVYQFNLIIGSNMVSSLAIAFLIFVHWRKGANWWLKVSLPIFVFVLKLCFLIIPVVNVLATATLVIDPNINVLAQPKSSWVIFNTTLFLNRIIDYLFSIRKSVMDDARYYLQLQETSKEDLLEYLQDL